MINLQNCNLISPLFRENLLVNVKTEVWPENKEKQMNNNNSLLWWNNRFYDL